MTCRPTPTSYLLTGEHYDADYCPGPSCAGCLPCRPKTDHGDPLDHCHARAKCNEHVPVDEPHCARCRGKTRRQLSRIADLTALLPVAAVESGRIESEAFNLAGPAANPEAWMWHQVARRKRLRELLDADPEE